jgi:hypothetical protein
MGEEHVEASRWKAGDTVSGKRGRTLDKRVEEEVESRMVESGEACDGAVSQGVSFFFCFLVVLNQGKLHVNQGLKRCYVMWL